MQVANASESPFGSADASLQTLIFMDFEHPTFRVLPDAGPFPVRKLREGVLRSVGYEETEKIQTIDITTLCLK